MLRYTHSRSLCVIVFVTVILTGPLTGIAAVTDDPVTVGDILILNPPPDSVVFNDLEHNTTVFMFQERAGYELPSPVDVDISEPGRYTAGLTTPSTIPAGTEVNCWFLHFDPVLATNTTTLGQVITFSEEILGIICEDATLNASDPVLGYPGTVYSTGQVVRGLENVEDVEFSEDGHSFLIHYLHATYPGEEVRIITAVPEPATLSLLALGGLALVRRRRR